VSARVQPQPGQHPWLVACCAALTSPLSTALFAALFATLVATLAAGVARAHSVDEPEAASGFKPRPAVQGKRFMAVTANRHATNAAHEILKAGGSAIDAAIAAQLVLGLTEPQSSGIGGGAFILHFAVRSGQVQSYDGREAAPMAAKPDRFFDQDGKLLSYPAAVGSGLSVGVPGTLRALELAHQRHGKLPWARLFEAAINIAESGFPISHRLHSLLLIDPLLRSDPVALEYFYEPAGSGLARPRPVGSLLRNPDYAATLRTLAREGADALYKGDIARAIVSAVASHSRPGDLTEADMAQYSAKQRDPICGHYRQRRICSMSAPSSGGIAVLAILGLLERFDMAALRPESMQAVHLFSEAGRLAFADRDHYVADPDSVTVPASGLIDRSYLSTRSALISPYRSMGRATHGTPPGVTAAYGRDATVEAEGTSHLSIVDADGNAVSMTTTIESAFGARIMVRGFLLNNQLTDFSWIEPGGRPGNPAAANAVAGGKRPRSAMAPTFVFAPQVARSSDTPSATPVRSAERLAYVLGSPGGPSIINYVARALVCLIDWNMGMADTFAKPHYGSRNRATELEQGSSIEALLAPLKALGHEVNMGAYTSGYTGIAVTPGGLVGAVDPRREGTARGE
jgi:gamma-glutamyltranspeptidase/glutathione hydrolase